MRYVALVRDCKILNVQSVPLFSWVRRVWVRRNVIAFLGYGDDNIRGNPINIVFLTTIGVVGSQIVFLILGLMLGQEIGSIAQVLFVLAGSAFWTAIISPLILKVISYLHSNIFGTHSRI